MEICFAHICTHSCEYLTFLFIHVRKKATWTETVKILLTVQKILIGVSCCGSQNEPQPPIFKYQITQNQNLMVFFHALFSLFVFLSFSFFLKNFFLYFFPFFSPKTEPIMVLTLLLHSFLFFICLSTLILFLSLRPKSYQIRQNNQYS